MREKKSNEIRACQMSGTLAYIYLPQTFAPFHRAHAGVNFEHVSSNVCAYERHILRTMQRGTPSSPTYVRM